MRIIHFTTPNGNEGIVFTNDTAPAEDFVSHGCTVESDTKVDVKLPSSFPMESTFEKVG